MELSCDWSIQMPGYRGRVFTRLAASAQMGIKETFGWGVGDAPCLDIRTETENFGALIGTEFTLRVYPSIYFLDIYVRCYGEYDLPLRSV